MLSIATRLTRSRILLHQIVRRALLATGLSAAVVYTSACASATAGRPVFQSGAAGAIARARADSLRYPYTKDDIEFMRGMIHHHAQAVTIARWSPTHGADAAVQRLSARIINAQKDEITLMQNWLADRNQTPPQIDSTGKVSDPTNPHAGHDMSAMGGMANMPGMDGSMPGMLTDAQLKELDAARGAEFDRLFLTYMIQHHRGAVSMVTKLFKADGAGQDETIFKFANDVEVDQSTEIRRMVTMMLELGFAPPSL
ncbi:MAG TPA: DUF305 domain-containing protein [Gemmatimonas sp.]|nr:DUF305 domain-containing protein [Gemmatimonas sp.]